MQVSQFFRSIVFVEIIKKGFEIKSTSFETTIFYLKNLDVFPELLSSYKAISMIFYALWWFFFLFIESIVRSGTVI